MPAAIIEMPASRLARSAQKSAPAELVSPWSIPRWFAVYTCSRQEKQVARGLDQRSVERFLPLYQAARRSAGKRVQLPLFPGYVFVHIALRDRLQVLEAPGVVRLVSFHGQPAPLDDGEIDAMRNALAGGVRAEPHPYIKIGREVEILSGPLQGLRGKVIRRNNRFRVVLSVDLLQRSIIVDVDAIDFVAAQRAAS